jgi:hypothetical protein
VTKASLFQELQAMLLHPLFFAAYPVLEDRALYSAYDVPYNYEEIPNDCLL